MRHSAVLRNGKSPTSGAAEPFGCIAVRGNTVSPGAFLELNATRLEDNGNALLPLGGGLLVSRPSPVAVEMSMGAVVKRNVAASGSQIYVNMQLGGFTSVPLWYFLPAPLGHYVISPDRQRNSTIYTPFGEPFPFECEPGRYGEDDNRDTQTSLLCTGLCPVGHYCSTATFAPALCGPGTYCRLGSSGETDCPAAPLAMPLARRTRQIAQRALPATSARRDPRGRSRARLNVCRGRRPEQLRRAPPELLRRIWELLLATFAFQDPTAAGAFT